MRKNPLQVFPGLIVNPAMLLCVSMALILALSSCSKQEEVVKEEVVRPAKILTITGGGTAQTRKYPGKVQAMDRVELSFEVSGKLVKLPVKSGQAVNKGDVIARLDARDFQSKMDAAQAQANQTKAELDRYANLLKDKVVAKSKYDVVNRNYQVAVSNVDIAKKALGNTILRASFSGRIGKRYVENFQVIKAKQPIVSLQKVGTIEIIVNAPEKAMATAKKENTETLVAEFSALPGKRYPLTLKEFATEADPQTQTYRIVLSMPTPEDATILDGMTATVFQTMAAAGRGSVDIPSQAVFSDEKGQTYVWSVGDDMRVKRVPVAVGVLRGSNIEVLSGLGSGSRIVTAGVQNITEGQKVRDFSGTVGE
jgi:RND family efflux transporter MFP subunit